MTVSRTEKPRIAWYWWPYWMFLLAVGLAFFYGVLTPIWMGLRLVAWLFERSRGTRRPASPAA